MFLKSFSYATRKLNAKKENNNLNCCIFLNYGVCLIRSDSTRVVKPMWENSSFGVMASSFMGRFRVLNFA